MRKVWFQIWMVLTQGHHNVVYFRKRYGGRLRSIRLTWQLAGAWFEIMNGGIKSDWFLIQEYSND